jgi:hypothetical protein
MAALKSGLNEAGGAAHHQVTDIPSKYICFGTLFCGAIPAKVALPLGGGESAVALTPRIAVRSEFAHRQSPRIA